MAEPRSAVPDSADASASNGTPITDPSITGRPALPLLPLQQGVVLPQMVVTLALESPEARDAADGASDAGGRVLLVPRTSAGGFATVGTVARVESEGELPNGQRALVLRGLARARVGAPVDRGPGVWVEAEPVSES